MIEKVDNEENLKILMIHNFHRKGSASGDDQVYRNERDLLKSHDNIIIEYTISNDDFDKKDIVGKAFEIMGMIWSFKNYNNVRKLIKKEKPDIVHVHTFFPLLSPAILYAAHRSNCKVVATLHDTRFACPCATSLRNAKICNECGDGHYIRMLKYRCFKNSRAQSLIVAFIFKYHRIRKSFYKQIDKYICLNDNQIQLLINIGFAREKIVKKYNFVSDKKIEQYDNNYFKIPNRYVVFYGRIGEEKGIRNLMKIWDKILDIPLVVMGVGPLEKEFTQWAKDKPYIYYLGYVPHEKCLSIVKNGEFIVFPSIWYEGCSMVIIETESMANAIIASDLGFASEAISNGKNGYKVAVNHIEEFQNKIRELWNDPDLCRKMGKNARVDYEKNYSEEDNYKQLMKIYIHLIEES